MFHIVHYIAQKKFIKTILLMNSKLQVSFSIRLLPSYRMASTLALAHQLEGPLYKGDSYS